MSKIRVVLLDDHKIVRDGLKSILALYPEIEVVGEDSTPSGLIGRLPTLAFDILLLDLSLPEMSGLDVLKQVRKARPDVHVIILSMHDNPEYMIKALKDGASAFLTKDIEGEVLVEALREVKKEGVYYPSQIHLKSTTEVMNLESKDHDALTPKEKEVLKMMIKGLSSKQIAAEFGLSSRTIEAHRLNIMKKLGTSNSAETIAVALKLNLIS